MNKCIFLDRDGVINKDFVDYVYTKEKLHIIDGVKSSLEIFKKLGYKIVVITNQSGIDKGIYTIADVDIVHKEIQTRTGNLIDDFYFCPYNKAFTNSIAFKPNQLMFEKAIYKHQIDISQSWMIGDRVRDMIPAMNVGIKNVILLDSEYQDPWDGLQLKDLTTATTYILSQI